MTAHRSYPTGPFVHLLDPQYPVVPSLSYPWRWAALTPAQRRILHHLRNGARLFFDVEARRALLYDVQHGLHTLATLSVRALATLVRCGYLRASSSDGQHVYYELQTNGTV